MFHVLLVTVSCGRTVGTGRNSQVPAVGHNGTNGDGRQRQHSAQHRYQVRHSQIGRRLPRAGRTRVQPTDTRDTRRTGEEQLACA